MAYLMGIAARSYDPQGALMVPWVEGTETGSINRRVSRVRTLDGGVAVTNRGYSAGDRTVTVSFDGLPRTLIDQARRLVRLHARVTLTIPDGAYIGAPSEYVESRSELTILITGEA